jgi:4'-phosphopantetheinyl transferase
MHVWPVPLRLPDETVSMLDGLLNPEERERSMRFHFTDDRRRFICSRGALRVILGTYLGEHPRSLIFEHGSNGKPYLSGPFSSSLAFNLSHSVELAVIGVASRGSVGIDVETVRELPELQSITEKYFTATERAFIIAVEGEERRRRFLHVWTRREATAKARGLDLSAAVTGTEIPLYPPGSGTHLTLEGDTAWFLGDLALGPRHIGAACAEGKGWRIVYQDTGAALAALAAAGGTGVISPG